jgi:hypothetical protein
VKIPHQMEGERQDVEQTDEKDGATGERQQIGQMMTVIKSMNIAYT